MNNKDKKQNNHTKIDNMPKIAGSVAQIVIAHLVWSVLHASIVYCTHVFLHTLLFFFFFTHKLVNVYTTLQYIDILFGCWYSGQVLITGVKAFVNESVLYTSLRL